MSHSSEPNDRRAVLERALQAMQELQGKIDALENEKREPIAILGMGCRFPGHVTGPEMYWELLRDGVDAIREVPASRWDIDAYYDPDPDAPGKMYTRMGGFLDDVDKFDPHFFGISPRETLKTDPQQRLVLEVGWEALEDAAIAAHKLMGSQTGVFLGITNNDYSRIVERAGLEQLDAYHLTGNCLNFAAGRIAYVFGFQGPTLAVDTACSSSGVAIHLACQSLRNRECNLALAGGVNLILSPEISITSTKARTLSPDGLCKTFDSSANGYVRGEGCGIVVLKRLSEALADGDRIQAVIRGSAMNQDGASSGLTVPNKLAQVEVIRQALERAGRNPAQVDYVEAHGTGTPLGDPIEVRALAAVYSPGRSQDHPLVIGAAKTNVGHLESAAAVAGLMKVVLSLQNRTIPPHLHFKKLNPAINLDEIPGKIPLQPMPWAAFDKHRLAGVSSFGGSGTITHMIVEEAPELPPCSENNFRSAHLLCLSAANAEALREIAERYATYVANNPSASLADVCYTAGAGRSHFKNRLSVVASTMEELRERIDDRLSGDVAETPAEVVPSAQKAKVAFLFTGQGGQYANMGRQLYDGEPVFRGVIDRCDELLRPHMSRSLHSVLYPESADTPLNETQYTHVAMFAIQYGLATLWRSWGVEPSILMGHSVGEIVAATVAGQLSLEHGLELMRERGRLMQSLPASGLMASLMAPEQRVSAALERYRDRVSIAAINGPESTVISGEKAAVLAILTQLESEGIKVKVLNVSNAFHSPLVEPVLQEFEEVAKKLQYAPTQIQLFSSMRLEMVGERRLDAAYWRQNLRNTVRFSEAIQKLYAEGYRVFVEIGPSPILVGMGSQCVPPGEGLWVPSLRPGRDDWQQMLESLGHLYDHGVNVNWDEFYRGRRARKIALPTYAFQRQRYWVDSSSHAEGAQFRSVQSSGTVHPLLGRRLNSAIPVFEQQLNSSGSFLSGHRIHGTPVFPATAYLEMALAAAREAFATKQFCVKNVVLAQPLSLPEEESVPVQLVITETAPGLAEFKIYSLPPSPKDKNSEWTLHAAGELCEEPSHEFRSLNLTEIRKRCQNRIETNAHYQSLLSRGLEFGDAFRGVEELWQGAGETLALVAPPSSIAGELERYSVHPALLDACLQAVSAALPAIGPSTSEPETYLPQRLEEYRLCDQPDSRLWSHVTVRRPPAMGDAEVTVDIEVCGPSGKVICEVRGLVLRRAIRDVVLTSPQNELDKYLYELKWEDAPRPAGTPDWFPSPTTGSLKIAESLASWSRRSRSSKAFQEFVSLFPRMEALCTQFLWRALQELGFKAQRHESFTTISQVHELGVINKYQRLLDRIFEMLREDGYLSKEGTEWKVSSVPHSGNPEGELSALLQEYPACSAELNMVGRCGRNFARAMRGECEPLQLLFPEGSLNDMERLYSCSPFFSFYNELVQKVVEEVLVGNSKERPLKILEIGGGTGSVTSCLLPELVSRRTEFVFTDVSGLFLAKAREKFAAYPFVEYQLLDIEKNPVEQGFSAHSFDLVIAANVLHATADLRKTLQHVQQLLSSEGVLVLLECTRPLRFADVIVGLTDGWWRFTDDEIRRSHALISAVQWEGLLTTSGFTEVAFTPKPDGEDILSKQSVILARGPRRNSGTWLVFDDAVGTGTDLCAALESRGKGCILVTAGDAFERQDDQHFEINPDCLEDFQILVRQTAYSEDSAFEGVAYLWPLKNCSNSIEGVNSLKHRIREGCGGVVNLVKALVSGGTPPTKNLWIVTRGVHSINSETGLASLSQSPASAVGSTISLEYPEIHSVRLDLAPVAPSNEAELLLNEILSGTDESLVAFRDEHRLVARLVQSEADSRISQKHAKVREPYQLGISASGILENLSLRPLSRRTPGAGEVEIEVHATGLGFRDVLMALGQYPEPSAVFGYECVGTIVRVGTGVAQFQAGERVIAVGPGSFSSFLTISAERIAVVPDCLDNEAAATIPSAFLTAHYALHTLGQISAGDKVLIHSAAGGVGLAAVQLAQRAKAEIFATAGSQEKRAYLQSLGIRHVFDSRSTEFSEEVMKVTAGSGVDIVLNSLTGEMIPASLASVASNGRFLEIGKNGIWDAREVARRRSDISYFPIDLASTFDRNPALLRSLLDELMPEFAKGLLKPLPHKTFPLDELIPAFRFMAQARQIGKVVISHLSDRESLIKANSSYLITGGLSGLGLLAAEWMAALGATHLVLVGRSEPSAQATATIREIEAKGVRVVISRGDVSDRDHLEQLFSTFGHSLPGLRGIIHSAGTLDDGVLAQQTWERFERVMAPKVDGAWHLHSLSQDQSLDFFVLFSSAVSILGSAGQANHVAACGFEDALAHYRRSLGLPALSINWGPWGEVGAATRNAVSDRLSTKGFHSIQPRQGLRVLEQLLVEDRVQIGVMSVDWRQYVDSLPPNSHSKLFSRVLNSAAAVDTRKQERKTQQSHLLLEQLRQAPLRNRRAVLEAHVREQAIRVLGLSPSFKLDLSQGLATLGMDSLMTIELKNRLQASVGKTLPSTIVFDHPTVTALAEYLEKHVLMLAAPTEQPTATAAPHNSAKDANDLEHLSDDEAEAILMKELSDSQSAN